MAGEGTRWVGLGGRRMVLEAQSVPASRNANHLTYLFTSGRRKKAQPARVDQLVYLPHNATGMFISQASAGLTLLPIAYSTPTTATAYLL